MSDTEVSARRGGAGAPPEARDDAHETARDVPPSSVRASAPTLHDGGTPPRQKVLVRTPVPPPPPDVASGAPVSFEPSAHGSDPEPPFERSVTAPTGLSPNTPPAASSQPRSGGMRSGVGATLGRYELLDELGHGGMATVYRAHDPRLDRDVAVKVIHHHLRDSAEIAERFRHEARAVAKLKHRSIVEIYDVPDSEDGERFLVAELVDGPSLRKFLQNQKQAGRDPFLPPELAAALVLQIADALSRAHEQGIIHRDVKPENILLAGVAGQAAPSSRPGDSSRAMPVAKLTDFGIAKILDAQGMTSTGQILGSPAHMSPEQIEAGEITPRVDVFATGVLFYELLTGRLPFDGKNPAQVIRRVLDGQFTPPDRVVPTVGGRWSAIVARLLARDPSQRPADARGVMDAIRVELDALGVGDPDRELGEYLRDPERVAAAWPSRMKPKLLERALDARARGDVVGAANDLNRALAYDPSDPKLLRTVTTLRARERWIRTARVVAPLALVAIGVGVGGVALVRKWQARARVTPGVVAPVETANATTATAIATHTTTKPTATTSATTSTTPSATTTTQATTTTTATTAQATSTSNGNGKKTRLVSFNVYPASASFTVDGETFDSSLSFGQRELSIGDHAVTATGKQNCCTDFKGTLTVVGGDGVQRLDVSLQLHPATIDVSGAPAGAAVTLDVTYGTDKKACTGAPPLYCPMTDTSALATVVIHATGFPDKKRPATLHPGDFSTVSYADKDAN